MANLPTPEPIRPTVNGVPYIADTTVNIPKVLTTSSTPDQAASIGFRNNDSVTDQPPSTVGG